MSLECDRPFCGTLALMIGQGPVTLSRVEHGVKADWKTPEATYGGLGANIRDAVNDCCENELEDTK